MLNQNQNQIENDNKYITVTFCHCNSKQHYHYNLSYPISNKEFEEIYKIREKDIFIPLGNIIENIIGKDFFIMFKYNSDEIINMTIGEKMDNIIEDNPNRSTIIEFNQNVASSPKQE